jgi:hypothetical protein
MNSVKEFSAKLPTTFKKVHNKSIKILIFCKKFQIPFKILLEFLRSKWQYWSNPHANCLSAFCSVNIWTGSSMSDENLFWGFLHGKKNLENTTL